MLPLDYSTCTIWLIYSAINCFSEIENTALYSRSQSQSAKFFQNEQNILCFDFGHLHQRSIYQNDPAYSWLTRITKKTKFLIAKVIIHQSQIFFYSPFKANKRLLLKLYRLLLISLIMEFENRWNSSNLHWDSVI